MQRFFAIILFCTLCALSAMAGDQGSVFAYVFSLTNGASATVTNDITVGEVMRVEVDQTANCTNTITMKIDSYIDSSVLVKSAQTADAVYYPQVATHKSSDGSASSFFAPVWVDHEKIYCTVSSSQADATTNSVKVYLFMRKR